MRERIQERIAELKKDFAAGQARLTRIDQEAAQLRETMLRISGAIQVLEEMLAPGGEGGETASQMAAE